MFGMNFGIDLGYLGIEGKVHRSNFRLKSNSYTAVKINVKVKIQGQGTI